VTNMERSTFPSPSSYGSSGRAQAADVPKDDLAAKGSAALHEAKTNVKTVISDVSGKGQEALNYAGQKGREAMDGVREVGDTLAVAAEKSLQERPYTTLALALATGFLIGATWRRYISVH
jgi:ElaB/YqjD/DUF883 family membrane-anchored ribosome-binding protein